MSALLLLSVRAAQRSSTVIRSNCNHTRSNCVHSDMNTAGCGRFIERKNKMYAHICICPIVENLRACNSGTIGVTIMKCELDV